MDKYCMKCMMPMGNGDICSHCGHRGDHAVAPHRLTPGTILNNRYLIGLAIGQGGFGITYMGRDLRLDMRVAVKEYYPNGYANRNAAVTSAITIIDKNQAEFIEAGKKKFLNEARALAQFHDERGVVEVRDYFEENETAYIVMEYLDGQDLRKTLRNRQFTADEIFELMKPVMDALEKVHEVGVVHRDISPDNIMLLKNGSVKLMDFGAARVLDLSDQNSVSVVLKAGYAPEEQYRPKGKQGPWTDIYALCATMYKCITGLTPDDALERFHKDELQWPSDLGIAITVLQEDILKKGMAVNAEDRYQNVGELKAMVEKISEPIVLPKDSPEEPPAGPPEESKRKSLSPMIGIGLAACVLGTVFGVSKLSGKESVPAVEDTAIEISETETGASTIVMDPDELSYEDGYYHITLTVQDEMTVKGFNKAIETLTGRIEVLTNGEPYGFKVNDDNIELALPEWALGDKSLKEVLQCFLTRAIDFYAFDFYSKEYIKIEREDLETVEFSKGTIEGVDPAVYEIKSEEYEYIKLVLTEEYAEEYAATIESWGEYLRFGQDMERNRDGYWYYTDIFSAGDGRTFYILDPDDLELQTQTYFNELIQWNLTHDILECGFWFNYDLDEGVEWQRIAEDNKTKPGEFQCDLTEISGETITVRLKIYESEELSDGQWLDLEGYLKKRLDALEQPYAIGFYNSDAGIGVAVKTDLKHMGYPIWQMLGRTKESPFLQIGTLRIYAGDAITLNLEKQEDGSYRIIAAVENEYYKNSIWDIVNATDLEQIPIVMEFRSIPYFTGILEKASFEKKDGEAIHLIFDDMYYFKDEGITEENKWFVEYLNETYLGETLPTSLSLDTWKASSDQYQDWYDLPVSDAEQLEEVVSQIQTVVENAEAFDNGTSILYVKTHLDVTETFAQDVVDVAEQIYEAIDFEGSRYSSMYLYLIDEEDNVMERARIIFSRFAQYETPGDLSKIQIEGLFYSGRMEDYKGELKKLSEQDAFCQSFEQQVWNFEAPQY
ncbi:MAG: serine/threonine protein kinase [Lachnoclostridium sp.]|nr:serine/threonine protein kinase [Lachnoclostridium sp.]